jgi:RHS repeat-associated protein
MPRTARVAFPSLVYHIISTGNNREWVFNGAVDFEKYLEICVGVSADSNQVAEYTYNGAGQRIKKVTQTETGIFHYDLKGHLIAETNQAGQMLAEYIYLGDQLLSMIKPGESVYYFHNDHLGTPQVVTDDTQAIAWKAVYTPFGDAVASIQAVENPFRFPGQYYDSETGLHYNYFRYYNPQTGRYITPDPIGLEGGINLFSYVANSPVNRTDPLGLWFEGMNVANNPANKVDRNGSQSSTQCETGRKKSCFERFMEEFERNRVPGANIFGLPTSAVSFAASVALTEGPSVGEKIAQHFATGAFESQQLARSGAFIKNYRPGWLSIGGAFRILGKVSWVVTVFYLSTDVTTGMYTYLTLDCEE